MTDTTPLILPELADEVDLRLARLLPMMREAGMDAMLIATNANIYYASGRFFRGYVYLAADGRKIYFVVRPNNFTPAPGIVEIRKPELIPAAVAEAGLPAPTRLGLDLGQLPYNDALRLMRLWPDAEVDDSLPMLRQGRRVKTPLEIGMMREDGVHHVEVYRKIPALYVKDMTDIEFQIEIERVLRREGCLGFLRVAGNLMEINMGSVVAGDNADAPGPYEFTMGGRGVSPALPCGACGAIMKPGQTVMVDVNGCFNGYQTDMTRVWSIGEPPAIALRAHECSIRILRELERATVPGTEVREMYARAMAIVEEEGLREYFMGHRQQAGFIGHGIGIELNEGPAITPKSRDVVEAGMTLAIEPKFVIPGVGAVGVENTYVAREEGLENLTPAPEKMGVLS